MVLSEWLPPMRQVPVDLEFSSLLPKPYISDGMCLFNAARGHGNKGQLPWLKYPIRLDPLSCMLTRPYQPISQSQHRSHVTAGLTRGTAMLASGIPASFPPCRKHWARAKQYSRNKTSSTALLSESIIVKTNFLMASCHCEMLWFSPVPLQRQWKPKEQKLTVWEILIIIHASHAI